MKKFLQKSCAWFVMLVAMFAMSMSAMAQDKVVTFDMTDADCYSQMTLGTWGTGWTNGYTMGVGSELGFEEIEMWGEGSGSCTVQSGSNRIYLSGNVSLTIASKNDAYKIQSIEFVSSSSSTYPALFGDEKISNDYQSYNWYYYETYEADEPVESVTFSQSSGYSYLKQIKISLVSGNVDPIEYTVNFTGDVPAGCSASYGDDTFTSNGSFEVAKSLKKDDLNITTTDDYYADVTLEGTTFNVEFKHWYTYNVSVNHNMGALEYNEYYGNGATFQSKTVVDESAFSAYDLNGYDEAVSVTQESEYVYNVAVTYTESAPITYTVTFNIVLEGAYAWINGVKYEGNDTFQTNLELRDTNIEQVYCPEGYYDNSYYSASDHTFYINYIEYDKFYVVVEGTEDPEAGVKYDYQTYHNGDIIYTSNTYYLTNYFDYYVTPVAVAGYNVEATLDDHTITVTYTEKPVPTAPWSITFDNTNNAECIVIDNNNDGSKWQWDAYSNRFQYTYNGSNAADDYLVLPAIKLEAGKNYNISVNCGAYSTSEKLEIVCGTAPTVADLNTTVISEQTLPNGSKTLTKDGFTVATDGNYYFAFHVTSPADKWYAYAYGFSIDVIEPEAAPEFPVEGVAYEIKNIGLGKYINISSAETDAATVSDESEGLYFTWDEMKAAFTIQDADGNYLGKTTNAWTTSATTPEYWIVETVSDGVYAFKSVSSKYLAPNKNDGTDNRLMRDKDSNFYYTFTIAPFVVIPDAELTVTDAEWTTFCSHTNVMLPADYTAYIVTAAENGEVTLKALEPASVAKSQFYGTANISGDGYSLSVSDAAPVMTFDETIYPYWGYVASSTTSVNFTITAPEGSVITRISPSYDSDYGYFQWEDETYGGEPTPNKQVFTGRIFNNGGYGDYLDFGGITIEYTAPGTDVVIPADAGVLVAGPAGTNIAYTKVPSATPSDVTGNLLVGCTADATWSEAGKSYYKFSLNAANEAGSEGFYWGVDGGASINAHAGKAYLVLDADAASNSRYLINGFGEPTGIDTVLSTEATEAIYNLQGQRVNAAKGGVYVKGGKKIIVK